LVGQTLSHYRIVAKLGAGGMGEVYRAHDTTLDREVALKVLPAELASDPDRLARFEREARSLAALDQPNIVTIYSIEAAAGPAGADRAAGIGAVAPPTLHFLTMQLVEGRRLSELIPRGGMPLDRIFDIAIPLADALAAAHEKGVIHRDLKPGNIMVTDEGRVKVLDFGLAKLRQEAVPEEATALPTEPLTELAASLPRELARIIRRCLVKEPERRFQTARELAIELEELRSEVASGEAWESVPRPPRRRRAMLWGGLAAAALVFGAAVALVLWGPRLHREPPATVAPPGAATFTKLVFETARKGRMSASPDGRFFVYASDASGNWDLYLQRIGGGRAINLTEGSFADDRRLAFWGNRSGIAQAWMIHADGSGMRRLTDTAGSAVGIPIWSPDGTRLATCSQSGEKSYVFDADKPWSEEPPVPLPPFGDGEDRFCPLAWSPDGRLLAGGHWRTLGIERTAVYSVDTGRYRILAEPVWAKSLWTAWLADSRRLLVNAQGEDRSAVFLIDTESGEAREVRARSSSASHDAAVVVLGPLDVVLAEIVSGLDLDKHQLRASRVGDAVPRAAGNIDGLPGAQLDRFVVPRDDSPSLDDVPVLAALPVALQAEPLTGLHDDALDLVVGLVGQHPVVPPGTTIFLGRLVDDPAIELQIALDHPVRGEALLDPTPALGSGELRDPLDGIDRLLDRRAEEPAALVGHHLRQATATKADDRRAAGHGFDD
jgi:hypothetical protein